MENEDFKYYLVDDVVVRVPANKDMTGYREVPRHIIENKCCQNCRHSIKDNPCYFCFYYRKYVWDENEIPEWCNKWQQAFKVKNSPEVEEKKVDGIEPDTEYDSSKYIEYCIKKLGLKIKDGVVE